jgi:Ubiquinol-cytochrome C reductase, UQCRX/QCR9 like
MASREAAMGGAAALRSTIYNAFFRRTSVYVTVCVAVAYASTEAYFTGTDRVWASINKGVSKYRVVRIFPVLFVTNAHILSLRCVSSRLNIYLRLLRCTFDARPRNRCIIAWKSWSNIPPLCLIFDCINSFPQKSWEEVRANLPEKSDEDDD